MEVRARIEVLTKQRKAHIEKHLEFLKNLFNDYRASYDQIFFGGMDPKIIKDEDKAYHNFNKFMISLTTNAYVLQNELNLEKDKSIEYIVD